MLASPGCKRIEARGVAAQVRVAMKAPAGMKQSL